MMKVLLKYIEEESINTFTFIEHVNIVLFPFHYFVKQPFLVPDEVGANTDIKIQYFDYVHG